MTEPVLAKTEWTKGKDRYRMTVWGGLHYIRGNAAPHFSLTQSTWRNSREECFGASHEAILARFPQFADLAALHLSDIDGQPTHAIANGWYNLAGCYPDAFGECYHRGNSELNMPATAPPDKPWQNYEHRKPTGDECLAFFADHCRISLAEAATIRDQVHDKAMASRDNRNAVARAALAEIMATMLPRWKAEADACITAHKLTVYGDRWERAAA